MMVLPLESLQKVSRRRPQQFTVLRWLIVAMMLILLSAHIEQYLRFVHEFVYVTFA